ncbi:MAG TPA: hypothetical protein VEY09_18775 [Pyrinomonadaceae bacterium]|nr:hypothetical protein [Pyrinomonadaceae bacterium]
MTSSLIRYVLCIVLVLSGWTGALAQLELGPHRLVSTPAPTLRNPTRLRVGLRRQAFLTRIGGVAFDSVAAPARGVRAGTIGLSYRPELPDGQRLALAVDGQSVTATIHDWQLIPIAKFADSKYFSCFTLFGKLTDSAEERRVRAQGGRVLNYHPAFVDTLLGLRLFQLDMLIIDPYSYDLVKNNGRYLLGGGETPPNTQVNRSGLLNFQRFFDTLSGAAGDRYNSYVVSDYNREIHFNFQGGTLNLSGEPSYYFWQGDSHAGNEDEIVRKVADGILTDMAAARQRNPAGFDARAWLTQDILSQARRFERDFNLSEVLEVINQRDLIQMLRRQGEPARRALLQTASADSLIEQLVTLRLLMDVSSVTEMRELSRQVSAETRRLRAINPAVWDAGVAVMRYGAFFRYVKANHPVRWRAFMAQINRAPAPPPRVTTPTVLRPGR